MKTKFQTNIIKKTKFHIFQEKHILCRFFCFKTCQNLEMTILRHLELRAGIGCKTEKNPFFNGNLMYFTVAKPSGASCEGRSKWLQKADVL